MDFSDQIALGARLADEQPEVGALERDAVPGRAARRVPGHLGRPGPDARGGCSPARRRLGRGHPVTAVGDPNQAIYGWRGASVVQHPRFAEHFPRADGRPCRRYPLTVNRRSDQRILEVANAPGRPALRRAPDAVLPLEAKPRAPTGEVAAPRPRDLRRRAGLARRRPCTEAHARPATDVVARSGC